MMNKLTSALVQAEVCVMIDGIQAPIYNVKVEGSKVSGVIESKDGAHFEIVWKDNITTRPGYDYTLEVFVDGVKAAGVYWSKDSIFCLPLDSPKRKYKCIGSKTAANRIRPFMFQKPNFTDNVDLACKEESIIKGLGKMEVKVCRVIERSRSNAARTYDAPRDIVINEKVKKAALSHSVGHSAEVNTPAVPIVLCDYVDPIDKPYQLFEFSYMNQALLEMNGHVEAPILPTPTPEVESEEDEEERADEEELSKLKAATQAVDERIRKRKGKKSGIKDEDVKKVKTEGGARVKSERKVDSTIIIIDDSDSD